MQIVHGRYVFVLRVSESWVRPHRVKINNKFVGRGSAGKYEMDTAQIRSAFLRLLEVPERARRYRDERFKLVRQRKLPFKLADVGEALAPAHRIHARVEPHPVHHERPVGKRACQRLTPLVELPKCRLNCRELVRLAEPASLLNSWSHPGWTNVAMKRITKGEFRNVVTAAWRNVAPKELVQQTAARDRAKKRRA